MSRKAIASLCLLLTLLSAMVAVTHQHSSGESQTCPLCAVAGAPAVIAIASSPKPVFLFLSTVRVEPIAAKYRLSVFALSVRPPPAA